ncbi:MAG: rhodanese-like domain-containing protein [Acidobacteriaceae bacterium]
MNRGRLASCRFLSLALFVPLAMVPLRAQQPRPLSAAAIPSNQLLRPAQLQRELQSHHPPLILQVGSRLLFDEAHISGAEYAGPASRPEGLALLRNRVESLPRDRAIVLYCGCCPWDRCPNIGPAWRLLHHMGFTRLRILYIAQNFGADWADRGFAVQKSQ